MKKPSSNTKRAFGVASIVGAVLMNNDELTDLRLLALQRQINAAMRVFNVKAGKKEYYRISDAVLEVWNRVVDGGEYNIDIKKEELGIFVDLLCTLLPPEHFKAFLGVAPYRVKYDHNYKEFAKRASSTMMYLNDEINALFGTTSYSLPVRKVKDANKPVKQKVVGKRRLKQIKRKQEAEQKKVEKRRRIHTERKESLQRRERMRKILQEKGLIKSEEEKTA